MENLHNFLKKKGLTISCAESLTGGRVQSLLTSMSGASEYFFGGICCYTIDQKVKHLGIDKNYATTCNCVSSRTAQEMASGCKNFFGSDIALSTTGYAEVRAEQGIFTPFAWIAIVTQDDEIYTQKVDALCPSISRNDMQLYIANKIIDFCLTHISQK